MFKETFSKSDYLALEETLKFHLAGYDVKLSAKLLKTIAARLRGADVPDWTKEFAAKTDNLTLFSRVIEVLFASVSKEKRLRFAFEVFSERAALATSEQEKRELMLELLSEIDNDPRQKRSDKKALARRLDLSGVVERYRTALLYESRVQEKTIVVSTELLANFANNDLSAQADKRKFFAKVLGEQTLEQKLNEIIHNADSWQTRAAALKFYIRLCSLLPISERENLLAPETIKLVVKLAQNGREETWVQNESLRLLIDIYPNQALDILETRLTTSNQSRDNLFIRAAVVRLIGERFANEQGAAVIERLISRRDRSDHVRVETMRALAGFSFELASPLIFRITTGGKFIDACEQVRVAGVETLSALAAKALRQTSENENNQALETGRLFARLILADKSLFVRKVALEELVDLAKIEVSRAQNLSEELKRENLPLSRLCFETTKNVLERNEEDLSFRRRVWWAREQLAIVLMPGADAAQQLFENKISQLYEGERCKIKLSELNDCSLETLIRYLSARASDDFGYFINLTNGEGVVVQRGERWGTSFWRILHELRNPAPDKRKGALHITSRKPFGDFRAPSEILAELTKTRVPGEPLYIEMENSWRPFVPLLTDYLDILSPFNRRRTAKLFTALGVTELICELNWREQVKLWFKLSWNFEQIAELRNVGLDGRNAEGPVEYVQTLATDYGVRCNYSPYSWQPFVEEAPEDVSLDKLFLERQNANSAVDRKLAPATFYSFQAIPFAPFLWEQLKSFVLNLSENTVAQLWLFFIIFALIFLAGQILAFYRIKNALKKIPLVLGGWGTRGKSGTERKKAALFHALGYEIFSKTTGCEAMFLHSLNEPRASEIFLYRPYDKATIWEMGYTAQLAARLNAEVYLWECMALNPRFVRLLQRQWTHDDVSTITNTYPDHEDIQGPAGIDIPRVMTQFLPPGKPAYTSEDQMLPILRDEARKQKTELHEVSWRDNLMITDDILERYPYQIHPRNMALVLKWAKHFGIERDFALKEIAEHIVPDLGVLKTYPKAEVNGRLLDFTNIMSANERRGFNDSWRRAGFAEHSNESDPGTWIITVVNNRADRPSRSQVFSEVIVADANAHKHVLIGTNLNGLSGYIRQSLEERLAEIDLYEKTEREMSTAGRAEIAASALNERFKELKIEGLSPQTIVAKTVKMLPLGFDFSEASLLVALEKGDDEKAVAALTELLDAAGGNGELRQARLENFKNWCGQLRKFKELQSQISEAQSAAQEAAVNESFRTFAKDIFNSKIIVVENSNAKGDDIIARIANAAPPGFAVRIVGMQNIKGTGLDFVYRWLALERVVEAARQLTSPSERRRLDAIDFFTFFDEYGLITRPPAINALRQALEFPANQTINIKQRIETALRAAEGVKEEKPGTDIKEEKPVKKATFALKVAAFLEKFLEMSDSKRRRKDADSILNDLTRRAISHERAAQAMREITVRQKGGWLAKKFFKD